MDFLVISLLVGSWSPDFWIRAEVYFAFSEFLLLFHSASSLSFDLISARAYVNIGIPRLEIIFFFLDSVAVPLL